ncbi:MAG: hypothetical protein RMI39_10015 [Thermoanaerobaculum sp.]|nr:hypothetical protein [Thermoanaerobaculum sp.]
MQLSDSPRKMALLGLLLVVLGLALVWRWRPSLVERVFPGGERVQVARFDVPQLPPVMPPPEPGQLKVGRNPFTFGAPPTPTPDRRPTPTPIPPPPPMPPGPTPTPFGITLPDGKRLPPPPPFSLPYLGWLGPRTKPVAVFRDGDEVLVVPVGSVVKDTFVLREVGPTSVTIGYLGYPEEVTTQVPLVR